MTIDRWLRRRLCANCDVPVLWGVICIDCMRAFVCGALGAAGAALIAWCLR